MRLRRIKEKIKDIFFGTILFPIGATLLAAFFWFGVFHPIGRMLVYGFFLRSPYTTGPDRYDGTLEFILILFGAILLSIGAILVWKFFILKLYAKNRNTDMHDDLIRAIIEMEHPNIDFEGADNLDVFRKYDSDGRLRKMSSRELKEYIKQGILEYGK